MATDRLFIAGAVAGAFIATLGTAATAASIGDQSKQAAAALSVWEAPKTSAAQFTPIPDTKIAAVSCRPFNVVQATAYCDTIFHVRVQQQACISATVGKCPMPKSP